MPDVHDILETMRSAFKFTNRTEIIESEFVKMPDQSIDYGIMEKVNDILSFRVYSDGMMSEVGLRLKE